MFKLLVYIDQKNIILNINISTKIKISEKNLPSMSRCCAIAEEKKLIILGDISGYITTLELSSLKFIKSEKRHEDVVVSLMVCLDFNFVASGSLDSCIKIFNIDTLSTFRSFYIGTQSLVCFAFHTKYIYAFSIGSGIQKISFDNSAVSEETKIKKFHENCFAVSIKQKLIAYSNPELNLYCLEENIHLKSYNFHRFIFCLDFVGQVIACGLDSGKISLLNIPELIEFRIISLIYTRIDYFLFSSRKDKLLFSSINRSNIIDFKKKEVVFHHQKQIKFASFHKNTDSVIFVDKDNDLYILRKNIYLKRILINSDSFQIHLPLWGDLFILKLSSNIFYSFDIKEGKPLKFKDKLRSISQSLLFSEETIIISSLNYCHLIR